MADEKLCRNCKHARFRFFDAFFGGGDGYYCHAPHLPKDVVKGGVRASPCKNQRAAIEITAFPESIKYDACGPKGKYYEPCEIKLFPSGFIG